MTNLTEKIKMISIRPLGIIAILLGITLSSVFLWIYVNQYLIKSKAYSQEVNLAWSTPSLSIASGKTRTISLQISTPNIPYKISGVDVTIKGDAKIQSISYQGTTPSNYFEAPLVSQWIDDVGNTQNKTFRLVLVAKKADVFLARGVIINLQVAIASNTSGTSIIKIDTAPQVVGTPSDRQFNIKTALPLQATINIIAGFTPTPQLECRYYYWFDNQNRTCGYRQFCGMYMYYGLRTFDNKEDCIKALNPTPTALPLTPNVTLVPGSGLTPVPTLPAGKCVKDNSVAGLFYTHSLDSVQKNCCSGCVRNFPMQGYWVCANRSEPNSVCRTNCTPIGQYINNIVGCCSLCGAGEMQPYKCCVPGESGCYCGNP